MPSLPPSSNLPEAESSPASGGARSTAPLPFRSPDNERRGGACVREVASVDECRGRVEPRPPGAGEEPSRFGSPRHGASDIEPHDDPTAKVLLARRLMLGIFFIALLLNFLLFIWASWRDSQRATPPSPPPAKVEVSGGG